MEIPRGIDMERLSARGTPQRYTTPGFEPIVDGKVLAYGFVGLVLLGGALLVLGLI
jgi:hypothetical protein